MAACAKLSKMSTQKIHEQPSLRQLQGFSFVGVSTSALCHDGKGNFLMMKRGQKARDEQERWDIVGGSLDFGLSVEENMMKEIQEEICVPAEQVTFLGYRDLHRRIGGKLSHWVSLDHLALVDREKVAIGEPDKIAEVGWFQFDGLPSPLHSQFAAFVQQYRKRIEVMYQV